MKPFCKVKVWFPALCDPKNSSGNTKSYGECLLFHKSRLLLLRGTWQCWYWWCRVCMVKSCSSMIRWQPSGFSMHTYIRILCHVCLVDSSGVLEQAVLLRGPWTHLSRLLMKNTNTWGTAGCLMHRLQRFIPAEKTRKYFNFRNLTNALIWI